MPVLDSVYSNDVTTMLECAVLSLEVARQRLRSPDIENVYALTRGEISTTYIDNKLDSNVRGQTGNIRVTRKR